MTRGPGSGPYTLRQLGARAQALVEQARDSGAGGQGASIVRPDIVPEDHCVFCHKLRRKVEYMVLAAGAHQGICLSCLMLAFEVLLKEMRQAKKMRAVRGKKPIRGKKPAHKGARR